MKRLLTLFRHDIVVYSLMRSDDRDIITNLYWVGGYQGERPAALRGHTYIEGGAAEMNSLALIV